MCEKFEFVKYITEINIIKENNILINIFFKFLSKIKNKYIKIDVASP